MGSEIRRKKNAAKESAKRGSRKTKELRRWIIVELIVEFLVGGGGEVAQSLNTTF